MNDTSASSATVRRKLPAPPATPTAPPPAAAVANNTPSNGNDEEAPPENGNGGTIEQQETVYVHLGDEDTFVEVEEGPSDLDGLTKLRNDLEASKRLMYDLAKGSRHLPLSRDTVYQLGAIDGRYDVLLMLVSKDIDEVTELY